MTPAILTKAQGTSEGLLQKPEEYSSTAGEETTDVFSRSVARALSDRPAHWLLPATQSLINLLTLPENWDSYGAVQVGRKSIAAARLILEDLSWFDTIAAPRISADPDGNVAFAWSLPRCSLDVEVLPDGAIEYVYLDLEDPGNDVEDTTRNPHVLAALLTRRA